MFSGMDGHSNMPPVGDDVIIAEVESLTGRNPGKGAPGRPRNHLSALCPLIFYFSPHLQI
jgi:hypothetical protein